jgi:hypothetical protein
MATPQIHDDDLERCALDRLADAAPVEQHRLMCEECRARPAGWDSYVGAMRIGLPRRHRRYQIK